MGFLPVRADVVQERAGARAREPGGDRHDGHGPGRRFDPDGGRLGAHSSMHVPSEHPPHVPGEWP